MGEVYKIYLQEGYFNEKVIPENRGADDYTTRVSIIMRMENEDIYILRIDLPHKGETAIHLNLEETVEDAILPSGVPFSYDEYKELLDLMSDNDKDILFYEMHELYLV